MPQNINSTELQNQKKWINDIFTGMPPPQLKLKTTDHDKDCIPRAIYYDAVEELSLRAEGFSGISNSSANVYPQLQPAKMCLYTGKASINSKAIKSNAQDQRAVVITNIGIEIINNSPIESIAPINKPPFRSPADHPVHSLSKHKALPEMFSRPIRYGSWKNTLASASQDVIDNSKASCYQMVSKERIIIRQKILKYKRKIEFRKLNYVTPGLSFRGRGILEKTLSATEKEGLAAMLQKERPPLPELPFSKNTIKNYDEPSDSKNIENDFKVKSFEEVNQNTAVLKSDGKLSSTSSNAISANLEIKPLAVEKEIINSSEEIINSIEDLDILKKSNQDSKDSVKFSNYSIDNSTKSHASIHSTPTSQDDDEWIKSEKTKILQWQRDDTQSELPFIEIKNNKKNSTRQSPKKDKDSEESIEQEDFEIINQSTFVTHIIEGYGLNPDTVLDDSQSPAVVIPKTVHESFHEKNTEQSTLENIKGNANISSIDFQVNYSNIAMAFESPHKIETEKILDNKSPSPIKPFENDSNQETVRISLGVLSSTISMTAPNRINPDNIRDFGNIQSDKALKSPPSILSLRNVTKSSSSIKSHKLSISEDYVAQNVPLDYEKNSIKSTAFSKTNIDEELGKKSSTSIVDNVNISASPILKTKSSSSIKSHKLSMSEDSVAENVPLAYETNSIKSNKNIDEELGKKSTTSIFNISASPILDTKSSSSIKSHKLSMSEDSVAENVPLAYETNSIKSNKNIDEELGKKSTTSIFNISASPILDTKSSSSIKSHKLSMSEDSVAENVPLAYETNSIKSNKNIDEELGKKSTTSIFNISASPILDTKSSSSIKSHKLSMSEDSVAQNVPLAYEKNSIKSNKNVDEELGKKSSTSFVDNVNISASPIRQDPNSAELLLKSETFIAPIQKPHLFEFSSDLVKSSKDFSSNQEKNSKSELNYQVIKDNPSSPPMIENSDLYSEESVALSNYLNIILSKKHIDNDENNYLQDKLNIVSALQFTKAAETDIKMVKSIENIPHSLYNESLNSDIAIKEKQIKVIEKNHHSIEQHLLENSHQIDLELSIEKIEIGEQQIKLNEIQKSEPELKVSREKVNPAEISYFDHDIENSSKKISYIEESLLQPATESEFIKEIYQRSSSKDNSFSNIQVLEPKIVHEKEEIKKDTLKINEETKKLPIEKDIVIRKESNQDIMLESPRKVTCKGTKCEIKITNFELVCTETAKNKPYLEYYPLELRRVISVYASKNDITIQACVSRKSNRDGTKLKDLIFTFTDNSADKWASSLKELVFGKDPCKKSILILADKIDGKESVKLVQNYMKPVFDAANRNFEIKMLQFSEFSVANAISEINFKNVGNILCLHPDFASKLLQILVRNQYSDNPAILVCEQDPVDAALSIIKSTVGRNKDVLHVSSLLLKREENKLQSIFKAFK